ncbi:flagellar basal body P-ring formation chaperone FlgA [Botrimarina sp.]|uniref:flagellar basal body P-ring formation chaperone FlgA n=1 Tax=Botrimarina sp. TaxID=2795802 RepID=UPI0032EE27CC
MRDLLLSTAALFLAVAAAAADIRLRESASVGGGLVRLGDVAEVTGPGARELGSAPLMPAPPDGETRRLSAGAVRDMLEAQGVRLDRHRFWGAYQVQISSGAESPSSRQTPPTAERQTTAFRVRPVADRASRWAVSTVERRVQAPPREVEQAVTERLRSMLEELHAAQPDTPRLLVRGVAVSATAARELGEFDPASYQAQWVDGGSLGPGEASALVWPESRNPDEAFRVVADLVEQPMRVVATQPLARGAAVVRSAVRLEPVPLAEIDRPSALGFTKLEEAVGAETLRRVRVGEPLSTINTAPPLVVRKGQEVEVYSGGGGVSVRLTAIAQGDGRVGDLVQVEAYDGRETFSARVVGDRRLAVLSAGSSTSGLVRSGGVQ